MKDIAALWISMSACIPTYMLASGLITGGMSWWQAVLTIFLGNVIVLIPMVLNAQGQDSGTGGWAYAGNTQDGDTAHPNDFIGWNFIANTNDPMDDNGHGTHVAGIIGARGGNGIGVAGVNWNVSLIPVRVLNNLSVGTCADLADGLAYAARALRRNPARWKMFSTPIV